MLQSVTWTRRGGWRLPGWRPRWGLVLVLWFGMPVLFAAGAENPYKVKAAFLRNFAHYVTWPPAALTNEVTWTIGILGDDPFGSVLEKTLEGRIEQGLPFRVVRAASVETMPPCQMVFVAYKDETKRRAALAAFKERAVLTIGEGADFLQEGGIISFRVRSRVEMSINLDQARAVGLTIPAPMLEVAQEVLEDDRLRRLR